MGWCWGDGGDDNRDENCQDNDDSGCDLVKVGGWTCWSGATLGGVVQSASLVNIYNQHFHDDAHQTSVRDTQQYVSKSDST